jgi:hypothetical protein
MAVLDMPMKNLWETICNRRDRRRQTEPTFVGSDRRSPKKRTTLTSKEFQKVLDAEFDAVATQIRNISVKHEGEK